MKEEEFFKELEKDILKREYEHLKKTAESKMERIKELSEMLYEKEQEFSNWKLGVLKPFLEKI